MSPEDVVWYSILHSLKRLLPVLGCSPAVARKSICAAFYRTARRHAVGSRNPANALQQCTRLGDKASEVPTLP